MAATTSYKELKAGGDSVTQLLSDFDNFVFDCDGVLWLGGKLLPKVIETLDMLHKAGKDVMFVTNNSTKTRKQYKEKFDKLGLKVKVEDIAPAGFAAAQWLKEERPDIKHAFVVGSSGLEAELVEAGVKVTGGSDCRLNQVVFDSEKEFLQLADELDETIDAVVMGWDLQFNFAKMSLASLHLQRTDKDVVFVATNTDEFDHLGPSRNIPGNGAGVSSVVTASARDPIVTGKPSKWLVDRIVKTKGWDSSRTIMVGDRLSTDVLFGKNGGLATLLVFTGCTSREELEAADPQSWPTYVASHVGLLAGGSHL